MHSERLAACLDGARLVKYDPNGYVLAWFGGHGLHVYSLDGSEVDYRSVGDFSQPSATETEIRAAAVAWATESEDEY
jgi:hypothetical protein